MVCDIGESCEGGIGGRDAAKRERHGQVSDYSSQIKLHPTIPECALSPRFGAVGHVAANTYSARTLVRFIPL